MTITKGLHISRECRNEGHMKLPSTLTKSGMGCIKPISTSPHQSTPCLQYASVNCSSKYFTWVGKITLHERHKTRNRHRKYLQTHQQLSRAWNKSFKNCGKMPFIMISFPGPQIYVRSRRTSTRSSTEQRPMLGVASAWNVSPCSTWVWTTSVRSPCSLVIPSG